MERNTLYPVFLKVSNLQILIVGGGNVALEKLTFLLKSSPDAQVELVSTMFRKETIALASKYNIKMNVSEYNNSYLENKHMVIATTDMVSVNEQVYHDCRAKNILVNVADNPPFCDFYMGGEDVIPDNIDDLVKNLNEFRKTIKGDFEEKVETLNEFTKGLVNKK